MAVNLRGRNFLKLLDFTPEEIRYLIDLSKNLKNQYFLFFLLNFPFYTPFILIL